MGGGKDMSAALTSGQFTRTLSDLALLGERQRTLALLGERAHRDGATPHVEALKRCIATCHTDDDFTALRVLARHAALNQGHICSVPLRDKLLRLQQALPPASAAPCFDFDFLF